MKPYQNEVRRAVTLAVAVLFIGLGIWLMLQPSTVETLYPMRLLGPMGTSQIRAIFGGLMVGIGGALLMLDLVAKRPRDASMVLATITAGLVLARAIGWVFEGFPSGSVLRETIFEVLLFILLLTTGAYRRSD